MSSAISDKVIPVPLEGNASPPRTSVVVRAFSSPPVEHPVLIDRIDVWAATELPESRAGVLHTETLGQLVERLAVLWTHWTLLDTADSAATA